MHPLLLLADTAASAPVTAAPTWATVVPDVAGNLGTLGILWLMLRDLKASLDNITSRIDRLLERMSK